MRSGLRTIVSSLQRKSETSEAEVSLQTILIIGSDHENPRPYSVRGHERIPYRDVVAVKDVLGNHYNLEGLVYADRFFIPATDTRQEFRVPSLSANFSYAPDSAKMFITESGQVFIAEHPVPFKNAIEYLMHHNIPEIYRNFLNTLEFEKKHPEKE